MDNRINDQTLNQQQPGANAQQSPFSQPQVQQPAQAEQPQQTNPQPHVPQPTQPDPAFSGMNTTQSITQNQQTVAQPTQAAYIPQSINPARMQGGSEATQETMEQKAHYIRDVLHSQQQVPIMIPLAFGEKPGTMQPFGVNGYFYYVQKGVMVKVPEQIAQMAIDSFNLDYSNGAELDLARNEDKQRNLA